MLTITNIDKLEGYAAISGKYRISVEKLNTFPDRYSINFREDVKNDSETKWYFNGIHSIMIDRKDYNAIADAFVLTYKNIKYYINIESLNNAINTMHQFAKIVFGNTHIDDIIIPLNKKA